MELTTWHNSLIAAEVGLEVRVPAYAVCNKGQPACLCILIKYHCHSHILATSKCSCFNLFSAAKQADLNFARKHTFSHVYSEMCSNWCQI